MSSKVIRVDDQVYRQLRQIKRRLEDHQGAPASMSDAVQKAIEHAERAAARATR